METNKEVKIEEKKSNLVLESRKKLSESLKGNIPWMKGKKHTEETKQKLRDASLGKKVSDETRRKISEKAKGRVVSQETRDKISKAQLTDINSMRGKSGEKHPNYGKKWSEESRKKMSESQKKLLASGYIHTSSKLVLDLETGFFYDSAKDCYFANKDYIKCNQSGFRRKLSGERKNNTKFQYV
jgi:hypothetical protein